MAKNGNASEIMKELLSNLFNYYQTYLSYYQTYSHRQQAMYVAMDTQQ